MSRIVSVIGGASSGKSKFAQALAYDMGKKRAYIATAQITDEDMRLKVQKHIENRKDEWDTLENFDKIDEIISKHQNYDVFMIECLTNMINNLMYHSKIDFENCSNDVFEDFCKDVKSYCENILKSMKSLNSSFVIVTNEMGLAVLPEYRYSRRFVLLQGELNQMFCEKSDDVYFVISGIPTKIK